MQFLMRMLGEILRIPVVLIWRLSGWRTTPFPNQPARFIIIGAPHTAYIDYWHALATAAYHRRRLNVTVKAELFFFPLGPILKALGGVPIERDKSKGMVQQTAERIRNAERMSMSFTPEGTRSYTDYWKTGFYYTALAAEVPILMAYFDYDNKIVHLSELFFPTGDIDADLDVFRAFYNDPAKGNPRYLEKKSAIRWKPKTEQPDPADIAEPPPA